MLNYRVLYRQTGLLWGFTAVFLGYLSVWLPGPGAGLSFLGLELGEWIKFAGVGLARNLFYLPPITLGLMLAVWTAHWPPHRWQNWAMRGVASAASLLAFPAIEAILHEPRSEWVWRLGFIGLVTVVALAAPWIGRWVSARGVWATLALLGVLGLVLPTWMYLQIRPLLSQLYGQPIGIGLGVWLNGVGHGLVTAVALSQYPWSD